MIANSSSAVSSKTAPANLANASTVMLSAAPRFPDCNCKSPDYVAYGFFNLLRLISYAPQMVVLAQDNEGAKAF